MNDAAPGGDAMAAAALLVAGASGMLGTALRQVLPESGHRLCAPSEADLDITDAAQARDVLGRFAEQLPAGLRGVVVNAAAYTDVERAEDEPARARLVNATGAGILASAAREAGLAFVHVSTDFVFDGRKTGPYVESDEPNPLSVYGVTKLEGECAVAEAYPDALVVRTAWLFGSGGASFPAKILAAARTRDRLQVVTDEVGSPTYTIDLARGIAALADARASGLYHLAGAGWCSRFELAEEVVGLAGLTTPIDQVTSDEFPTKAARPANSVLDCSKAAARGVTMRDWRESLAEFVAQLA